MPTFCRHNRLIQNCPICSREQAIEQRPLISSSAPRSTLPRPSRPPSPRRGPQSRDSSGVRVRRLERGADDGYRSGLVPGLKSSEEAERLAEELAFATTRLSRLASEPPGLYAEVADPTRELEERIWTAFLIAYLCPLDEPDPFTEIAARRTSWASGEQPVLDGVRTGPRAAYDPSRGAQTLDAYRSWAARSGSQGAAFAAEPGWNPQRRFARVFERLALPGLHRDARFDLLVTLGGLRLFELSAGALVLGGSDQVTVAAKRALGIGDPLLLERRAAALAAACEVPLAAIDLALYNWERGERATVGLGPGAPVDPDALERARGALGL